MNRPRRSCRVRAGRPNVRISAFSLLELIVVVSILGLLSTLAALTLRGHLQHAALNRAVERIKLADQQARQLARSGLVQSVRLSVVENRLLLAPRSHNAPLSTSVPSRGKNLGRREFRLPQGVRVTEIGPQTDTDRSLAIEYFRNGTSTTTGLRLELSGTAAYMCVLGMGGQTVAVPSEYAVKEILSGGS